MTVSALALGATAGPVSADYSADISVIGNWLEQLQYRNASEPSYGAVRQHHMPALAGTDGTSYYRVVPSAASLAVLGALRAKLPDSREMAQRWIHWYLSHLDLTSSPPGVVVDHWYRADGTSETTCPPGLSPALCEWDDASSSYAATLLAVTWQYHQAGGRALFNAPEIQQRLEIVADLIIELQNDDGLAIAKSTYAAAYLTSNSEVALGLRGIAQLEQHVFRDPHKAARYGEAADRVTKAISSTLWNAEDRRYRVADMGSQVLWEADLTAWDAGTIALAWPHLFGVASSDSIRSREQMSIINTAWAWDTSVVDPRGFRWTSIGYAALLTGDRTRAQQHADMTLEAKLPNDADPVGFAWPFAADDAGWLLSTLAALDR